MSTLVRTQHVLPIEIHISGEKGSPAAALILSAQYPRDDSKSRFSAAWRMSMDTIQRVLESGIGNVRLMVAGRNVRYLIGGDCRGRLPKAGDAGRPGRLKPLPSKCTAGDRERVKGRRSGARVGLFRLEFPECEGDESLACLFGGLPDASAWALPDRPHPFPSAC